MVPAARVRLNAIAASTSQAVTGGNEPEGRWAKAPKSRSAPTLLDDRVAAMGLLAWSVASGEWVNTEWCR